MEFYIDNRETKIIEYFKKNPSDCIEYSQLDLGDFMFKYNGAVILIIERKTIEDMASSIKDGRYREQKSRLVSNFSKNQILYIIEGDLTCDNKSIRFNKVNKKTIYSSIINMYIRDNIHMFHSVSIENTIEFLENIMLKIQKNGLRFIEQNTHYENTLCKNINIVKKKNITPKIVYKTQLCSIPGISSKYADAIIEIYPNMVSLINELSPLTKEEKKTKIQNITYRVNQDKIRKLGKKVANNVVENIFIENVILV